MQKTALGRSFYYPPRCLISGRADRIGVIRSWDYKREDGARYRVRTCDPYRVKVMLYH